MIEMLARLYCDRCNNLIAEINDMDSRAEAEDWTEKHGGADSYALDEDGQDVCAECWRKWDAAHPAEAEAPAPVAPKEAREP